MLTQDFIQNVKTGGIQGSPISTTAPTQDLTSDSAYNAWKSNVGASTETSIIPTISPSDNLGTETAKQVLGGGQKIAESVTGGAEKIQKGDVLGGVVQAGLGSASGAVQSIFAPLTATFQKVADATGIHPMDAIANSEAGQKLSEWAKANPDMARNLSDALNVGMSVIGGAKGGDILGTDVGALAKQIPEATKGVVSDVTQGIKTAQETAQATRNAAMEAESKQSAIADATPAYNKTMIGKGSSSVQVTAPDGTITTVPRVQEGGGVLKMRTVTPTASEIAAGHELTTIPNYPVKGTALEKFNAIEPEIASRAKAMETSLKNEGVLRPPKEIAKIVRDAVNTASQDSLLLQKSDPIVANYMRVTKRAIAQSDGTLSGELKVRQALDNAYDDAGGKYNDNKGLDQIHRAARNALNDDIEAKATNTEVKAALKSQSNLYKAADVLQDKARAEGGSALEQAMKAHPITSKVIKAGVRTAGLGAGLHLVP